MTSRQAKSFSMTVRGWMAGVAGNESLSLIDHQELFAWRTFDFSLAF